MTPARSKLTAQGRTSVPKEIRRRLGLRAGSVLEWSEEEGAIVVRRVGLHTSEDIHRALFAKPPERQTLERLEEGLKEHVRDRYRGRR